MQAYRYARLGAPTLSNRGFTLIEIMITLVIVGILAAIALPNFNEHIRKTARVDAQIALRRAANDLERIYLQCNTYNKLYDHSEDPPCVPSNQKIIDYLETKYSNIPPLPATKRYKLEVRDLTSDTWIIRAFRQGLQVDDRCGDLSLDHTGAKIVEGMVNERAGVTAEECWRR